MWIAIKNDLYQSEGILTTRRDRVRSAILVTPSQRKVPDPTSLCDPFSNPRRKHVYCGLRCVCNKTSKGLFLCIEEARRGIRALAKLHDIYVMGPFMFPTCSQFLRIAL